VVKNRAAKNHVAKNQLDSVFGALTDPTRRAMIADLVAHGSRTAGELAAPHAISLPAVSKHLAVLERAGLATRQRRGRHQVFTLAPQPLRDATTWLEGFWDQRLDALATYLEETT
jgi:DNA-binding transcriptional ArsR family regulator